MRAIPLGKTTLKSTARREDGIFCGGTVISQLSSDQIVLLPAFKAMETAHLWRIEIIGSQKNCDQMGEL
jgi:hypothetical protein